MYWITFKAFILDNCQASGATNVKSNYDALVHIDSHQTSNILSNTTDIVVCFCLNDFKKENGATKIWPKSHLSKKRIQNDKEYKKKIKKKFIYAEAKQGSIIFFLGQTWHQIKQESLRRDGEFYVIIKMVDKTIYRLDKMWVKNI